MPMDACCATNDVVHDTDHLHLDDPTLADCCRRDLKEQAYNSRVRERLRQCDISEVRQRVSAGVIKQQIQESPDSASDVDSLVTDSEDEGQRRTSSHPRTIMVIARGLIPER